jgi:hypothetical protein
LDVGKSHGIIAMGYVQHSMKCWTTAFPRDHFLLFNFESIKKAPDELVERCYGFLDLDAPPTPPTPLPKESKETLSKRKNVGFKLELGESCIQVDSASKEKSNGEFFGHFPLPLRKIGEKVGFVKELAAPTVGFDEIEALREIYAPEIDFIERLLDQDLSHWRTASPEDLLRL